ncbi:MAG: hypothetical protein EBZ47_01610 [Chlamydiae bacterium]|nr:hypothetical protein [Chlamydiota bacterium]
MSVITSISLPKDLEHSVLDLENFSTQHISLEKVKCRHRFSAPRHFFTLIQSGNLHRNNPMVEQILKMAAIFEGIDPGASLLHQTVVLFGKNIKRIFECFPRVVAEKQMDTGLSEKILIKAFLSFFHELKQVLHNQALLIGSLYTGMQIRSELVFNFLNEGDTDVQTALEIFSHCPKIILSIQPIDSLCSRMIRIDISEAIQQINEFMQQSECSADVDRKMIEFLGRYLIKDTHLYVSEDKIPNHEEIEQLLKHKDEKVKWLGKLLFLARLYFSPKKFEDFSQLLWVFTILQLMVVDTSSFLTSESLGEVQRPHLLFEKLRLSSSLPFAPYLEKLLQCRADALLKQGSFLHLLFKRKQSKDFFDFLGPHWHTDTTLLYSLVIRVETAIERWLGSFPGSSSIFFHTEKRNMQQLEALTNDMDLRLFCSWVFLGDFDRVRSEGSLMTREVKKYQQFLASRQRFCMNYEEFYILSKALSYGKVDTQEILHPSEVKNHKNSPSNTSKKEKLKKASKSSNPSPFSFSDLEETEPSTLVEDFSAHSEHRTSSILESFISETQGFLDQLAIADRVESFFLSQEEGISYRGMDSESEYCRSQMILTHRFPREILYFLFHPKFSICKEYYDKFENLQTCFQSVIYMNEKKYVLEGTVDRYHVLYHLCARELKAFQDYSLLQFSPTEFPALSTAKLNMASIHSWLGSINLAYDLQGDARFMFENKSYKIVRLHL